MFSYVEHVASSYHKARKCRFYISYRTNHIGFLIGFLIGFQEDIKIPRPMEQVTIAVSLGVLLGFQRDINVPRPHGTINHTVIRVSHMISRRYENHHNRRNHHHHRHRRHCRHLGLPERSLRVRTNLRVLS